MEKKDKVFTDCSIVFLEKTFGLREVPKHESMTDWLSLSDSISLDEIEKTVIGIFQKLLTTNVSSWHEQDLSLHFIGPILSLVGFTEPYKFNLFAERRIAADITGQKGEIYHLYGKPDEMVASGFREPESPFFCFQEYKREKDPNGDPIAQALAAMLVGQAINENQHPMYGCYILGRDWYFMTLRGTQYCISKGFDATTEQVYLLFSILKALKVIVQRLTQ
jgi:hypothetical protein